MTEAMLRKIIREEVTKAMSSEIPEMFTPKEVSKILDITTGSLANMRSQSIGPEYKKIAGKVKYLATEVADYINKC